MDIQKQDHETQKAINETLREIAERLDAHFEAERHQCAEEWRPLRGDIGGGPIRFERMDTYMRAKDVVKQFMKPIPDDSSQSRKEEEDNPDGSTPGQWGCSSQGDEAKVWGPDGDVLATAKSRPQPGEANANARLMAVAGTAVSKLPEGCDPITLLKLLPEIYRVADWAVGSTKFRDEDGIAHPPDREFIVQLRELLNDTREDWLAEGRD
jgi:hypothetical protein